MTTTEQQYLEMHTAPLIPLDMSANIPLFLECMREYQHAFRAWGVKHLEHQRYGLPLVNANGQLHNNPEPVCYPLDQWNAHLADDERVRDHSFQVPTEILSHTAFDFLEPLKDCILRSCILKWMDNSMFYPHTDTKLQGRILRLWGTDRPDMVKLRFDRNGVRSNPRDVDNTEFDLAPPDCEVEAGRMYLIDTNIVHDAHSYADNSYQFFLSFDRDKSYEIIQQLKL